MDGDLHTTCSCAITVGVPPCIVDLALFTEVANRVLCQGIGTGRCARVQSKAAPHTTPGGLWLRIVSCPFEALLTCLLVHRIVGQHDRGIVCKHVQTWFVPVLG